MSENKNVAFDADLCSRNPEAATDRIAELEQQLALIIMQQDNEFQKLKKVESACKRLTYIVRKSVNSGPLSKDPTQEADAWRELRMALGEGYDERGNLIPIPKP